MIREQTTMRPAAHHQPPEALVAHIVTPLTLIAQAVSTALRSRGITVEDATRRGHRDPADHAAILVVIDDLVAPADVRRVMALVRSATRPVLVLTSRERGHYWGALVAAGATSVMPAAASLDELVSGLTTLDQGGRLLSWSECEELVALWDDFVGRQREVVVRLKALTPRECVVLDGLRGGATVSEISAELGVRDATVRSHVRSILRKLGVRSQLAAVALARGLESPLVVGGTLLTSPRAPGLVAGRD